MKLFGILDMLNIVSVLGGSTACANEAAKLNKEPSPIKDKKLREYTKQCTKTVKQWPESRKNTLELKPDQTTKSKKPKPKKPRPMRAFLGNLVVEVEPELKTSLIMTVNKTEDIWFYRPLEARKLAKKLNEWADWKESLENRK